MTCFGHICEECGYCGPPEDYLACPQCKSNMIKMSGPPNEHVPKKEGHYSEFLLRVIAGAGVYVEKADVIRLEFNRGRGVDADPIRKVVRYYDNTFGLLLEIDPEESNKEDLISKIEELEKENNKLLLQLKTIVTES